MVPLSLVLVAHRDRYFEVLGDYRAGRLEPLIGSFATAARIAAAESRVTAQRLAEAPDEWSGLLGPVRTGSATAKILTLLPARPVLSAEDAGTLIDAPTSSVYSAIERLHVAGVLRPLTPRKRNQVWGASLVLDELDDLGIRIARAAT